MIWNVKGEKEKGYLNFLPNAPKMSEESEELLISLWIMVSYYSRDISTTLHDIGETT